MILRISKRNSLVLFLFFAFVQSQALPIQKERPQLFEYQHLQMGTMFRIMVYAMDSLSTTYAVNKAFQRLDDLNIVMSDYREDSELNQLCRTAGTGKYTKVSHDLWVVLNESLKASKISNGTFDVTIGSLTQLWRRMKRQQKLPTTEAVEKARQAVGWQNLLIKQDSVLLKLPNMRLDLGGIGKGFAEDEMMKVLKENGIQLAMIEGGGNILIFTSKIGEKYLVSPLRKFSPISGKISTQGWKIKIDQKYYYLKNGGISTSGDLFQFVEIDGKKYSHILNPTTGIGMTSPIQVSVIAKDGITSDWLSKAVLLLPRKEAAKLAKQQKIKVLW